MIGRWIIDNTGDFNWLKICFLYCKMYLISAEGYANARVHILTKKAGEIRVSMKYVHNGLGVKNMSDLSLKEIYGRYGTNNLTKEQIKIYKITGTETYENYDSLSESELIKKSYKKFQVKNDIMTSVIKHY